MEIERGRFRSHSVENSLWTRLRTCGKTHTACWRLLWETIM